MTVIVKEATLSGTSLDGKFNFILSNPFEEDAYHDLVGDPDDTNYGWDLSVFKKNPASFWAHDTSTPPIARWENVGVRNGALRGTLVFPEKGIYPFADQIHALCRAGIIKGVSVGFRPVKSKPRANGPGTHWLRMTLVEASLCGIPALPSALMEAKQLGITEDVIQKVFRMSPKTNKKESIGERIRRARRVVSKAKRMLAATTNAKSRSALMKAIAILEQEDRERMETSRRLPPASQEQRIARAKAARAKAEAVLHKTSFTGQQQRQQTETIEKFTALSKLHSANPPMPKSTSPEHTVTWKGQTIDQRSTWRGKRV